MKKIIIFLLFFIYPIMVFANDDLIIIDNIKGEDKIKITILEPCFIVNKETTVEKKDIDKIDIESNEDFEKENINEEDFNEKVSNNLENFLSDLNNKNINESKEKKTTNKTILENYFNIDTIVKNNDKLKLEKILDNIYEKIFNNLKITDLYKLNYDKNSCKNIKSFLDTNNSTDITDYVFSDELIDNDFVISMELEEISETEIKIQLFIWDILDEKFSGGKYYILRFNNKDNNSYRISNMISDFIFKTTTGEKEGLFDSKIMYISETGSPLKREKQVTIMNFDGSKNIKVIKNKNIKLTPIFSKYDPNEIFYMEYLPEEGPFIVKHNLQNNIITKILIKDLVMTSAANFNPNNKNQLILAGSVGKSTNLFLFDFKEKKNRQITEGNNINTSPSFSPDGKKVVYVSDKSGFRKLYIKDLENSKEELLTKEDGIYDKPSWSPDGKLIAFVKLKGQQFQLGIMNYRGEAERILTSSYLIEGIKWSPNSRYLIYTKQKGAYGTDSVPRIYIKDILTGNEYRLQTPIQEGASDPDWIMNK